MDNSVQEESPLGKKQLINKLIKFVLPLIIGIGIIYFLLKDVNLDDIWGAIKNANWGILAFSLIFGLLGNVIRSFRWELLIRPLGYKPSLSTLCYAVIGGYAVNVAFPRAGEIWKCGVVAKEEKIPFPTLFGTIILDRVLDTLTVLLITFIAFLFNMDFFIQQLGKNRETLNTISSFFSSPLFYTFLVAGISLLFIIYRFFKDNFIIRKVISIATGMWRDMTTIWKMRTKNRLLIYSISIWLSYFIYFYITFYAFKFTENLGITAGLTAFALSSLSMGVPSNGGLGPWQVAVIASLTLYTVDKVSATAFATGVFAVQTLWTIFCGLVGIAVLSLRKQKQPIKNINIDSK